LGFQKSPRINLEKSPIYPFYDIVANGPDDTPGDKGDVHAVVNMVLTRSVQSPDMDGRILSLKILDQKGFKTRLSGGRIHIMKVDEIYTEGSLGGELYKVKMKIVPSQEMATIKSQETRADEARRE